MSSHNQVSPHGYCLFHESHLDVADIFHMRPFADMINDETFLAVNGPLNLADVYVLHLESIESDLEELYSILCQEYGYCEKAPKRFPKVFPASNDERKICAFNPLRNEYSNCETTWQELWSDQDLVRLVQENYALDFELFGYNLTPDMTLPLKWM